MIFALSILGLLVGSFLNVVLFRFGIRGESLIPDCILARMAA